ncbi:hypothetical protein [Burkholderia vietnamiensis]|uniref:hypothetical protein n=1 Tax=Burkholderia cepacia complex TaxID=87882 RepID=UPI0015936290|nr:hypothetical protein [Burkholderia vietnamiensis]
MNQVKLPEIVWASNGFATEIAKVDGIAIGHVALRGRPDYDDAYEVILYNSEGEKNSWSGKPDPAATAHVGPEQDKATFLKMVEEALERGTPSDVLTIMKRNGQRNGSFPERVRFNWGFHDGTAEAERAAVRDMEGHQDRAYAHGYVRGVLAWKNLGYRPETSDEAWSAYQNHPVVGQATGKLPEVSVAAPASSPKAYRVEVTGGGDLDKSPGVAIFEVSEESARNIIKLSSVVRANDLYKVEKYDCRAQYLQYDPETDPDDALDAGEENAVRSECDMLVVTDDAFYFRAYVKHTDVAVECASQPIAELAAHFAIPFEDPRHQGNSSSPTM